MGKILSLLVCVTFVLCISMATMAQSFTALRQKAENAVKISGLSGSSFGKTRAGKSKLSIIGAPHRTESSYSCSLELL